MFQNNSEHCNSACQSFTLTTFVEAKKLSHIHSVNEMTDNDVDVFFEICIAEDVIT